jgi:hypothetical protein
MYCTFLIRSSVFRVDSAKMEMLRAGLQFSEFRLGHEFSEMVTTIGASLWRHIGLSTAVCIFLGHPDLFCS